MTFPALDALLVPEWLEWSQECWQVPFVGSISLMFIMLNLPAEFCAIHIWLRVVVWSWRSSIV